MNSYGLINPASIGNKHSVFLSRMRKEISMETRGAIREVDDQVRRSTRLMREVQDETIDKMARLEEMEQKMMKDVQAKLEDYRQHLDDMMMMIRECPPQTKQEEKLVEI
jgi:hypothetical protein